jgi:uncharacterized protein YjbI with pentapeptide repeats
VRRVARPHLAVKTALVLGLCTDAALAARLAGAGWLPSVGLGALCLVVGGGVVLWSADPERSPSQLGAGLVAGALVAIAVGITQYALEQRVRAAQDRDERARAERDRRFAYAQQQSELRITVSMQRDLEGLDLVRRDLRGFVLARKNMRRVDLSGARLDGANLSEANLDYSRLACPVESTVRDVLVCRERRLAAHLVNAKLIAASLREAHLQQAVLRNVEAVGADFTRADLRTADASLGDFSLADFTASDLNNVNLFKARLEGADFQGADIRRAMLCYVRLRGSNLRRADLSETLLVGADLRGGGSTRWNHAWRHAAGVGLVRRHLRRGALANAVDVAFSTRSVTDLRDARLRGADLREAIYDENTLWPDGFDPHRRGAVKVVAGAKRPAPTVRCRESRG